MVQLLPHQHSVVLYISLTDFLYRYSKQSHNHITNLGVELCIKVGKADMELMDSLSGIH